MGTDGISRQSRIWNRIFTNRFVKIAEACGGKGFSISK